jgi:shikimate dehydrogenase
MMHLYGLIGYPLSHSFSRKYFTEKFQREGLADHDYQLFPLRSIEELPGLLEAHPDLLGLNVTIPYKQAVLPYLDRIDPLAEAVGAVNTIRRRGQTLSGHNSDVFGFSRSLEHFLRRAGRSAAGLRALVLGSGGAARAVRVALDRMGVPATTISRSPERGDLTYRALGPEVLSRHHLIVNTTPLGMAPDTGSAPPLPYEELGPRHLLFDLVYNPEETLFLRRGKSVGCKVNNGLEMLYLQAERSWDIWRGED